MAPSPSRRPQPKGRMKTGICVNKNYTDPKTDQTGPCPKCASGEKIRVEVKRISDFRCPVCGGNLKPVKGVNWKLWISIGAAVAVLCLVLFLFLPKEETETKTPAVPAKTEAVADSVKEDAPVEDVEAAEPEAIKEDKAQLPQKESKNAESSKPAAEASSASSSQSVLGGAAVMSKSGGYTTLKFKGSYSLDNGDADHSSITINPGDEIYMANVRNGILYGGQLKRCNGEEVALSGLKVCL